VAEIDAAQLAGIPIFKALPDGDIEVLRGLAHRVEIAAGDRLFRQEDAADCFYAVLSGGLDIVVKTPPGAERLVLHTGPGTIVGETSLLIGGRRSASARATAATVLLRFPDDALRKMLDAESLPAYRIVHRLAQSLANRLRELDAHIAEMSASEDGPPEEDLDRLRRIFFTDWGQAAQRVSV